MITPEAITPTALPSVALTERRGLPTQSGIYFVLTGETVLYIGQAASFKDRWAAHHRQHQLTQYSACRIAWLYIDDLRLLDALENACIEYFQPVLNRTPTWRVMVRLPGSIGEEVEQIAREQLTPTAVLLRRWINERIEVERKTRRREIDRERESGAAPARVG